MLKVDKTKRKLINGGPKNIHLSKTIDELYEQAHDDLRDLPTDDHRYRQGVYQTLTLIKGLLDSIS